MMSFIELALHPLNTFRAEPIGYPWTKRIHAKQ